MPSAQLPMLKKSILEEASRWEVPLSNEQGEKLETYLALIARWNPRVRLVGSAEPDVLVGVHLADTFALAKAIETHPAIEVIPTQLLDVGTGAGLPGFALALILPAARVTLCEVSEKRVSFLYEADRRISADVEILPVRVEEILSSGRLFHQVVSRATFSPMEWRDLGSRLCHRGGLIWSLWTEEQEKPFLGEDLFRLRYQLSDGRSRVIAAARAP